jgi:hypothetical protein
MSGIGQIVNSRSSGEMRMAKSQRCLFSIAKALLEIDLGDDVYVRVCHLGDVIANDGS